MGAFPPSLTLPAMSTLEIKRVKGYFMRSGVNEELETWLWVSCIDLSRVEMSCADLSERGTLTSRAFGRWENGEV